MNTPPLPKGDAEQAEPHSSHSVGVLLHDAAAQQTALERTALVVRAANLRAGIQQIFDDAAHWNRVHVPWKGAPIDPDPDGKLMRLADSLDRMLAREQHVVGKDVR